MIRLLRLAAYPLVIWFVFRVAFPGGEGRFYHLVSLPLLWAGSAAAYFFIRLSEYSARAARAGIEAAFIAVVVLFVGFTLPQRGGTPPLVRLARGQRPTRSVARDGLTKLGLDPHVPPGRWIIELFPAR